MTNSYFKHAVALGAAVTTTLILFSGVVALADDDKRKTAAHAAVFLFWCSAKSVSPNGSAYADIGTHVHMMLRSP